MPARCGIWMREPILDSGACASIRAGAFPEDARFKFAEPEGSIIVQRLAPGI